MNTEKSDKVFGLIFTLIIIGLFGGLIAFLAWGVPKYRIYRQTLRGEANLREQEWAKKILVEQAKAQNESATLNAEAKIKLEQANADAEIIRAKGVAEANRIIADSLKNNESYLKYLWIDKVGGGANVMYVPTETGLPILEAGKR